MKLTDEQIREINRHPSVMDVPALLADRRELVAEVDALRKVEKAYLVQAHTETQQRLKLRDELEQAKQRIAELEGGVETIRRIASGEKGVGEGKFADEALVQIDDNAKALLEKKE